MVDFTVPPFDVAADLVGDPVGAELVVFMNGNQFMVVPELVEAFEREQTPTVGIFVETLPPGVLEEQLRVGALRVGKLVLRLQPDVMTAGFEDLERLHAEGLVEPPVDYARNDLALLVRAGNALNVRTIEDLGRPGLRVAMPDPATEGVGRLILRALRSAGGPALERRVLEEKVRLGETTLTRIHHRQSPSWLQDGAVDAAPLWSTEAHHHLEQGADVELIRIDPRHNQTGRYAVAIITSTTRRSLAERFLAFMAGDARTIYARHGFAPPGDR